MKTTWHKIELSHLTTLTVLPTPGPLPLLRDYLAGIKRKNQDLLRKIQLVAALAATAFSETDSFFLKLWLSILSSST